MQPMPPASEEKGFFGSLFDYSFSSLITERVIRIAYVIITMVVTIGAVGFILGFASRGGVDVGIGIVGGAIFWLLYLIVARISLELVMVIFRIGDDVRQIARRTPGIPNSLTPPPTPPDFPPT